MSEELLKINGLKTHFPTSRGIVRAVDGVNFTIRNNEIVGIVGESGSGKSVTALSIMGLIRPLARPPAKYCSKAATCLRRVKKSLGR